MVGLKEVQLKLTAAAPRILAYNRSMITVMLDNIKPEVIAQTPLGPGHFGYHTRDTFTTDVKSEGIKSVGVLKSAVPGFWREFGTKRGERARKTAHIALAHVRRIISVFYGGQAAWWRLP